MDIHKLIHLIGRNGKLLIIVPILAGILMFILTRNQTKTYSTKASVFTAITAKTSLEDLDQTRVDFFATKAAYNNLLSVISSVDVIQETSLRLLAQHLVLDKPTYAIISDKHLSELKKIIPKEIKALIDKKSEEKTYRNLNSFLKQDKENFLYNLLNYTHAHYSVKAISSVKTEQLGSSDIIQLSYQSNDPGIAYQTLNILIKVFINKYGDLKKNQTNAVVEYFEKQLGTSSVLLSGAEDRLLDFNKSNNIVNYYEQTKHISSQQEKIEVMQQEILMEFKSAAAVLSRLEMESKVRFNVNLKTNDIMALRQMLIERNQQLANLEIFEGDSLFQTSKAKKIKKEKAALESNLQSKIDSINVYKQNTDGVAIDVILNDWLKTVLDYESAKARLLAIDSKNLEFNKLFGKYAPLGAILKRIEREIDVKEKEYLEILHHLGLAKLKQQNEELLSNMKVLDSPVLPISPEPSKRKILIILMSLFGFIFTFLGIVISELFDSRIKSAKRFSQLTGLKVSAVHVGLVDHTVDIKSLITKGLKPVIESILEAKLKNIDGEPVIVQFFSNRHDEGKSKVIGSIALELDRIGCKSMVLVFGDDAGDIPNSQAVSLKEAFDSKSYLDHIRTDNSVSIILVEIPALSVQIFNTSLFKTATLSYLIGDASRKWSAADAFLLEDLKNHAPNHLSGILNKVQPDNMDDVLHEIPKERSKFRKFIKNKIMN